MELSEMLKEFAIERKRALDAESRRIDAAEKYQKTEAYREYCFAVDEARQIAARLEELEAQIKKQAVDNFDGENKRPANGIEIKAFTTANIVDLQRAREWAMTNYTPALKLDTKAIEKAGKDGLTPDGLVVIETEYRAQIASDLRNYLQPSTPKDFIPRFWGDTPDNEAAHQ